MSSRTREINKENNHGDHPYFERGKADASCPFDPSLYEAVIRGMLWPRCFMQSRKQPQATILL